MSLSLLRRSSSIDSKLRCSGDLRFKNQSKIPSKLPTTPTIVAIIFYFRLNLESTSTTACKAFSGWSPGMNDATAITAVRRAVIAPSTPSQSTLIRVGMSCSMPLAGCQRLIRRLINSQIVLNTAPETNATSQSFVLMVCASRSMLVRRP